MYDQENPEIKRLVGYINSIRDKKIRFDDIPKEDIELLARLILGE